ncbi:unnamed protein product, partial [Iphiclides podalirius]
MFPPDTCRGLVKCGEEFCLRTSIHGFNHIAIPKRHWTERVLWLFVTAIATWGVVEVSLGQFQRYSENPTVVTLEKDFRSWRFALPGVTICDQDRIDPSKLPAAIKRHWRVDPADERYAYYGRFVNAVANSDLFHLEAYQEFMEDEQLNVDLYQLAVEVMPDNQVKTTWSGEMGAQWVPVMTEAGACFAINSVALADVAISSLVNDTATLPLTCRYSSHSCYVMFESSKPVDIYIHSPYDAVDITGEVSRVFLTLNRATELSVMESRSGREVRSLRPHRRRCLYSDEPAIDGRRFPGIQHEHMPPFVPESIGGPPLRLQTLLLLLRRYATWFSAAAQKQTPCSNEPKNAGAAARSFGTETMKRQRSPVALAADVTELTTFSHKRAPTTAPHSSSRGMAVGLIGATLLLAINRRIMFIETTHIDARAIRTLRCVTGPETIQPNTVSHNTGLPIPNLIVCEPTKSQKRSAPIKISTSEEGRQCGPAGMQCLASYANQLANFGGVKCPCSQQCVDAVFREVSIVDQLWDRGPFQNRGSVRFTVQPPRTRYTREIVFHFEDLVVSFGGAAGLFLGASFISFVEIVYFILEKLIQKLQPNNNKEQVIMINQGATPFERERIEELARILEGRRF